MSRYARFDAVVLNPQPLPPREMVIRWIPPVFALQGVFVR
jgi:hypothetical protein